jgi:hypothetical protein
MRLLIRIVAVLAAVSVFGTVWIVTAFVWSGALILLLKAGLLGAATIVGWVIALAVGPIATVQLWRFRQSRRAGIILFGSGLAYYLVGLLAWRAPGASVWANVAMAATYALPLAALLLPRTRTVFAATKPATG